jgi:hypothetical protein
MTALDELVKSGLPLEVVVDDQDFTQELLRSGQVMGCVTTLSQALRGCTVQPWAPCAMWPWPRPSLPGKDCRRG